VREVLATTAPRTLLAEVQTVWTDACGEAVAAEASPVAERDGIVTVACGSSTWASELDLMQPTLVGRINELLGEHTLEGLRFTADAARHRGV
jgi:predicted nucleic acid-binding Zn ribbon protein